MTDRSSRPDSGAGHDRESSGAWRWAKLVAIVALILALVVVVVLLVGGGHRPRRHQPFGSASDYTPPPTAADHASPSGMRIAAERYPQLSPRTPLMLPGS